MPLSRAHSLTLEGRVQTCSVCYYSILYHNDETFLTKCGVCWLLICAINWTMSFAYYKDNSQLFEKQRVDQTHHNLKNEMTKPKFSNMFPQIPLNYKKFNVLFNVPTRGLLIQWKGYSISHMDFLPKMFNLNYEKTIRKIEIVEYSNRTNGLDFIKCHFHERQKQVGKFLH